MLLMFVLDEILYFSGKSYHWQMLPFRMFSKKHGTLFGHHFGIGELGNESNEAWIDPYVKSLDTSF